MGVLTIVVGQWIDLRENWTVNQDNVKMKKCDESMNHHYVNMDHCCGTVDHCYRR